MRRASTLTSAGSFELFFKSENITGNVSVIFNEAFFS